MNYNNNKIKVPQLLENYPSCNEKSHYQHFYPKNFLNTNQQAILKQEENIEKHLEEEDQIQNIKIKKIKGITADQSQQFLSWDSNADQKLIKCMAKYGQKWKLIVNQFHAYKVNAKFIKERANNLPQEFSNQAKKQECCQFNLKNDLLLVKYYFKFGSNQWDQINNYFPKFNLQKLKKRLSYLTKKKLKLHYLIFIIEIESQIGEVEEMSDIEIDLAIEKTKNFKQFLNIGFRINRGEDEIIQQYYDILRQKRIEELIQRNTQLNNILQGVNKQIEDLTKKN